MPSTTNFGWTTPADTDYVKDGALAIRTLGNGIDTSLVDLKGGTTGQVLSKASNTDLDYTWTTPNVGDITEVQGGTGITVTSGTGPIPSVAIDSTVATLTGTQTLTNKTISASSNTLTGVINNTLTTTTGDIIYASSANTPARLAIGSSGQVLTVSGGIPAWAAASSGKVLQVVSATTTTATTIATTTLTDTNITASITPSATSSKILILLTGQFAASRSTTNVYVNAALKRGATTIADYPTGNYAGYNIGSGVSYLYLTQSIVYLDSPSTTSSTTYKLQSAVNESTNSGQVIYQNGSSTSSIILIEIGV